MGRTTIKLGDKFGQLLIVEKAGKKINSPHRTIYKCLCDCGNYKLIDAGNLRKPNIRSCGCLRRKLAIEKGKKQRTVISFLNLKYGEYKRSAKYRNINFSLTKEQFNELVVKNCFYCDLMPTLKNLTKVGIEIPTHGIDRVDNKKGYFYENCVPCCKRCNMTKMDMDIEEFLNYIKRIYLYKFTNNNL